MLSGVTPANSAQVTSLLETTDYANYDVARQPDGTIKVSLKQAAVNDIETRALDTSIEVIRDRIDALGTKEPLIQKYGLGDNEILVEVPGQDDPGKVDQAIHSASKLAVYQVLKGPWTNDQEGAAGAERADSAGWRAGARQSHGRKPGPGVSAKARE